MISTPRHAKLAAVAKVAAEPADDDFEIARQRTQHLAPWNVSVLQAMHSALSALPAKPLSEEARERCQRLALQILVVQMLNTTTGSPLR